jgi:hypothetical protein
METFLAAKWTWASAYAHLVLAGADTSDFKSELAAMDESYAKQGFLPGEFRTEVEQQAEYFLGTE